MRFRFVIGLLAVLMVALGSVVVALVIRSNEVDHFHTQQNDEALRAARQAEAVAQLSVGELATAGAFFEAEPNLTRHEFEVVGSSLLQRGALNAAAYIEKVPASERAAYQARNGFPIIERREGLRPELARSRPVYYPVTYVVSHQTGQAPLGYNIASDPERGPALELAGRTGRPAATNVMPLLLGGHGINVYRPVYRDGRPTATVAEREAALLGFAAGAFRVHDLAAAAISALPEAADVQLRSGKTIVVGPGGALDDPARASIEIANRTWSLIVHDPGRPSVGLPLLVSIFGIALAGLLGALVLIWSRNERMRVLQREASQDPLTGLKNRRRFEEDLHRELALSRRQGTTGALLSLDLDNFKQVNDTLGHPVGDRVIEEIAGVLGARMRETDVLARIGGDEFAIVLPNSDESEARRVADSIAGAIREHVPQTDDVPQITISIGIAMFGAGTGATFDSVQTDADAAMYEAKDAGRDSVRASS
jgi:diguanylate cyclase (GGDEF)-like protein